MFNNTFDKSVGFMLKAYHDNSLEGHLPSTCIAGTLVHSYSGYKLQEISRIVGSDGIATKSCAWEDKNGFLISALWQNADSPKMAQIVDENFYRNNFFSIGSYSWAKAVNTAIDAGQKQVAATGYTIAQLRKLERVFMMAKGELFTQEHRLRGMLAVVDVLAEFHNVESSQVSFVKQYIQHLLMEATFENSVKVLLAAKEAETLELMGTASCLNGQLVAAANGYQVNGLSLFVNAESEEIRPTWQYPTWTAREIVSGPCYSFSNIRLGLAQIESTGYTLAQFIELEKAFCQPRYTNGPNGLFENGQSDKQYIDCCCESAINKLADIHNVTDDQRLDAIMAI